MFQYEVLKFLHDQPLGMFMVYFQNKLRIPDFSDPLIIISKRKGDSQFPAAAKLLLVSLPYKYISGNISRLSNNEIARTA
jgi:hypothetical protein